MLMDVPAERAKTLSEAAQACDVQALEGEALERYYVQLAGRKKVIALINTKIKVQTTGQFLKLLFTGHVGCGKSSELAKIAEHWESQYQIVFVNVEAEARVNDLEFTDLYLLAIKRVEEILRAENLSFDPILQSDFENWFKEIVTEQEESSEKSIELKTEAIVGIKIPLISKLLSNMSAQIKGGAKEVTTTREKLRKDFKQLRTLTNLLLRDGADQIKTKFPDKLGIFIIFDGLDKCPKEISSQLFFENAAQLQELHCPVIDTVPIGALYTPKGISKSFQDQHVVPMINIYSYSGDRPGETFDPDVDFSSDGLDAMASLVERRVDVDAVFESKIQLYDLCKASGGHLRFLMQMVREACLIAEGLEHVKVQDADVTFAIKQLQFRFEREIPSSYYEVLAKIAQEKKQVDDFISPETLYITAVLEYNGESRWMYPNPVVRRSALFQEALSKLSHEQQNEQS
jgi:AAA ATPase domain